MKNINYVTDIYLTNAMESSNIRQLYILIQTIIKEKLNKFNIKVI